MLSWLQLRTNGLMCLHLCLLVRVSSSLNKVHRRGRPWLWRRNVAASGCMVCGNTRNTCQRVLLPWPCMGPRNNMGAMLVVVVVVEWLLLLLLPMLCLRLV